MRSLDVLGRVVERGYDLSLTEIVAEVGIPTSTVSTICALRGK